MSGSASASPIADSAASPVVDEVHVTAESSGVAAAKPVSKPKAVPGSKKPTSKSKAVPAKKPASATKKPASAPKKAAGPKKAAVPKSSSDKLSYEDMIKDAIQNDKENVRGGVSRPAIKKYLAIRFKVLDTPSNIARLNKAISRGAEKGIFALPKGASGKVKLAKPVTAPKSDKPESAVKVAKKPVAAKPVSKKAGAPVKKPATAKSVAAKKAAVKVSDAAKKTSTKKAATGPKKAGAVKRAPAKKATSSTTKKVKAAGKK